VLSIDKSKMEQESKNRQIEERKKNIDRILELMPNSVLIYSTKSKKIEFVNTTFIIIFGYNLEEINILDFRNLLKTDEKLSGDFYFNFLKGFKF
jgi:hypothetical protein